MSVIADTNHCPPSSFDSRQLLIAVAANQLDPFASPSLKEDRFEPQISALALALTEMFQDLSFSLAARVAQGIIKGEVYTQQGQYSPAEWLANTYCDPDSSGDGRLALYELRASHPTAKTGVQALYNCSMQTLKIFS